MSVDAFINQFSGLTESYLFYRGEIELRYEPKRHQYLLVNGDDLIPVDGVTSTCHIVDKSEALVPWACKQMASALLKEMTVELPDGQKIVRGLSYQDFENLILKAKTAHKDTLEDAGDVGHEAHAWIERYIKAVIRYGSDSLQVQETLAKFPDDQRAANCCMAALDWMRAHNVRWLSTERKIYSRKYGYAGTMDGLCLTDSCSDPHCCKSTFKDRLTVCDWKTSGYLYVEFLLQTAAYQRAYNEEIEYESDGTAPLVTDRWIIRLGKVEGEFDPWHAPIEDFVTDFTAFVKALELKRGIEVVRQRVKDREATTREEIRAERKAAKEAAEQAERERKAQEKAERKAANLAALKIKCKGADKYQGKRAPKCNKGQPCEACRTKYAEVQASKANNP